MKKLISALMIILILGQITAITSHAESYAEEWLRKQQEQDEKRMDELAKDGNLTQEAIDTMSKGKSNRKPTCKTTKKSSSNTYSSSKGSSYSGEAKGYVYSTDELHVIGLPEDERGYTKAGDYGKID